MTQKILTLNGFVKGEILSLEKVKEESFAKEMLGKTIAVTPVNGEIYAPVSGIIDSIFPTKHALTLIGDQGEEFILHLGIDTVKLNGSGFNVVVTEKQQVNQGDLLIEMDLFKIKKAGLNPTIFLILTNSDKFQLLDKYQKYELFQPYLDIKLTGEKIIDESEKTSKDLETNIIHFLGSETNIDTMTHCATRLRVNIKDKSKVDKKSLEKIPGVMGVVESMGGIQIIIGNNVEQVYDKIQQVYQFNHQSNSQIKSEESVDFINRFLNTLSAIIGPAIPLIMASGLISALLVILTKLGLNSEGSTYYFLNTGANVAFYFLPFLLAYTSAKRFKTDIMLSMFMAGVLLHPNILALIEGTKTMKLFGIPVTAVNYATSLIPIILTIWILSHVNKFIAKILPSAIKFMIQPLLVILIMLPLTLWILGPIGAIAGEGLSTLLMGINARASWLALLIMAALSPVMVMTGIHLAFIPIVISNFETIGYDNLLFVAFIGMNFSQFAISLAVMLKTKNTKLREVAGSSALTAFLCGVTEPALYGITVKLKKPFIATFAGCIANGIFCAITSVKVFSFGAPAFVTLPIFMNPDGSNTNFIMAIIAITITIIVSFVTTWLVGFDDNAYENQ